MKTLRNTVLSCLLLNLPAGPVLAQAPPAASLPPQKDAPVASGSTEQQQALEAGVQAVIYGLPLVMMDLTMRNFTNAPPPRGTAANRFLHERVFPTASFKQVVRVNVDTLYSSAFLDLSKGPLVLSVPDTHGRYYLLPLFDAWTNVFATPGTRTTGNGPTRFVIAGPDWTGSAPPGLQVLKSPTNIAWLLGRTQTNGPADYAAVHAIQDGYKLEPLSRVGAAAAASPALPAAGFDTKTPPVEKLKAMSAREYFNTLAQLMKTNPPPPEDAPILAKLARIGIVPGKLFDFSRLDPQVARALERSVSLAIQKLQEAIANRGETQAGKSENGWIVPPMIVGNFATNYLMRGIIALIAFGANLPADAVYPTTYVDGGGNALNGANRYVLHFEKGQIPPVNAFWSVTLYGPDSFFVGNTSDRYAVSSWMPLKRSSEGSLDIYIQRDSPGKDNEANWLPAPEGEFNLTLRMYWPKGSKPTILDGSWIPPGVMRISQ